MRRLLALPLAAAFLLAPSASADDVPCYGVHAGDASVGVCAGVICVDLCGPQPVVHGQCSGIGGQLAKLCNAIDDFRPVG